MSEDLEMPRSSDGRCGDAALYLLGLLDERQAARFRGHADDCAVCRDEIGALRPAVDVLPTTVPQMTAPEHVKKRVMTVVRAEARGEEARSARRGASPARRGLSGLVLPRPRARRPVLALLATGLLAAGVAIGALSLGGVGGSARTVSADVTIAGASAVLHESAGHNWLTADGLPQPRPGYVYEVWVKRDGGAAQPTSSLFSPTTSGAATAAVPSDVGGGAEVMVTEEPAGGSRRPTGSPFIVARLT